MHVIYGGTFDPIHHGHLRLALEVSDALTVGRIHLVPCHIPPHRGDPGASSAQRLELIRLAIEGEERLQVDDRELSGPVLLTLQTPCASSGRNWGRIRLW